jgi:hypothetical protein
MAAMRASLAREMQVSMQDMQAALMHTMREAIAASSPSGMKVEVGQQVSQAKSSAEQNVNRVNQGQSVPGMHRVAGPTMTAGPGNEDYIIRENLANKMFPLEKFGDDQSDRFRFSQWRQSFISSFSQIFQIAPGILQLLIEGETCNLSMDNTRDQFLYQSLQRKVAHVLFTRAKQRVTDMKTKPINYGSTPPLSRWQSGIMMMRALDSIYELSPAEVQKMHMTTSQLERDVRVQTYSSFRDVLTLHQEQLRDFGKPLSDAVYVNQLLKAAPKTQKWRETMADLQRVISDQEAIAYADSHEDNVDVASEFRDSLGTGSARSVQPSRQQPESGVVPAGRTHYWM